MRRFSRNEYPNGNGKGDGNGNRTVVDSGFAPMVRVISWDWFIFVLMIVYLKRNNPRSKRLANDEFKLKWMRGRRRMMS